MSGIHKKMLVAGFAGVIWKAYFLTLEKFNFKKRKDCATIKSKYVTGDCEGIDFVIRTIFPIFERIAAWFGKVQQFSQSNRKNRFRSGR